MAVERTLAEFLQQPDNTQGQLAQALGLSQAAISRWYTSGRDIRIVEKRSRGKVAISAYERRPLGKCGV